MNILFLPAWYPSRENPVYAIYIREHAKAAALYNDLIVLYCNEAKRSVKGLYETTSDKIEDGIRTIRIKHRNLPIPKASYLIYIWSIFVAFRKLIRQGWKPDIIHAHVYSAGVPAVILSRIYKIPVAITEHYIYFPPRVLSRAERIKARFSLNRAQIILPPTKAYKEAIECYGIKNKFWIIPNVVDMKIFYPSLRQDEGREKRLLFVGNLVPKKAIPHLLRAIYQINERREDFILDIVGDGPKRGEYEEMVQRMDLSSIVKFHGMKHKEDVAEFMRKCSFFVMPSIYEGFGVVYIEAMACGKPVIASNVRGPDEIVNEEVGILVPPEDIKALKEAVEYMLDNYQNYSKQAIVQYVRERFSYEVVGKILTEVYQSMA